MTNKKVIQIVLKKILNLQPGEKFLIITDTVQEGLAKKFYDEALKISSMSEMIIIEPLKQNGQEPFIEVTKKMKTSPVMILLTEKSLSHTAATREAVEKGARLISCPGITREMLERCVDIDYDELAEFHDWLRPFIVDSKEIKVTSPAGTEITFSVKNTHGKSTDLLKNQPGKWGNLPMGEVDSGVEGANGKIVIDGSMAGIGLLKEPIVLEVKDNITSITSDNTDSKRLREILDKVGPKAYQIAEFGIGTNPKAQITGKILEDEKVKGTVHFAVGNDLTYGGENNVPIHLDGLVRKPTIMVDGEVVMEEGKFLEKR